MNTVQLFVITHDTKDYGERYVVREHRIHDVNSQREDHRIMLVPLAVCSSLEEARGAVEEHTPSLVRFDRCRWDDDVIVESWCTAEDKEVMLQRQHALRTGVFL
jgi:hypothetical protein